MPDFAESPPSRSRFLAGRRIFAIVFGLTFASAFLSLAVQVRGLFGGRGIVPADEFLKAVHAQLGATAYWEVPSLCWLGAGDGVLVFLCVAGALLSIAITVGFAPGPCSLGAWAIYLSLCSIGSPFLNFQWDALLLETALLAAFWLPWRLRPVWGCETRGQVFARWLIWWLLFRLMFESGLVKLSWGDATWWNLTALHFHFETQPLPLWTAWHAHQAPGWLLGAATFLMFAIELVAPFLIIGPRRWRRGAAVALIALQAGVAATAIMPSSISSASRSASRFSTTPFFPRAGASASPLWKRRLFQNGARSSRRHAPWSPRR